MTKTLSPIAYSALLYLLENETNSEWNSGWNSVCEKASERECAETYNAEDIASELVEWASNLY